MKRKKLIFTLVGVVCLLLCASLLWFNYNFSATTVEDAIESAAIEDFESVYKIADVEKVGNKEVCIFESRADGMGISVLENHGTDEKQRYEQLQYTHVSFDLIGNNITKYETVYDKDDCKIVVGIVKNLSVNYINVNGKRTELKTYNSDDSNQSYQYWVCGLDSKENVNISLE